MPKPTISIAKFHRDHGQPDNRQPVGTLHTLVGSKSLGFLRGTNLAVGYKVAVVRAFRNLKWSGTITERVSDGYSQYEGDAFLFEVTRDVGSAEGGGTGDDTITVTVTTTDPIPVSSDAKTASNPQPSEVP